ncbi:hypothetical protein T09_13461 [Trichinella sp. T9]|uniref:Uncharacterized protein n=1 Tax=Trichinella murrelli TaxID=144512 RepID=A0A0V0T8F4_9BILA|nr:hypothetical protein T05_4730 [Trichinella murrelli]KRX56122.1 hypothetical protein T09_13461 [Trichinella sp. T9]
MCGYLIELSLSNNDAMAICIIIAQGETSLQMLGKQIDSQLMSNYWAHTMMNPSVSKANIIPFFSESTVETLIVPLEKLMKPFRVNID